MSADSKDIRDPKTYAILGACMEVHRSLGHGFLEAVYQSALEKELAARGVPFVREAAIGVLYKGEPLDCSYKADFVCFGDVLVELKALDLLSGIEEAQVINYLKATGFRVGLLVNFGTPSLQYKRFISSKNLRKSAKSADRCLQGTGESGDIETRNRS